MISPEKIEEWLKEAEERPASMAVILQYLANRVRDLTGRNEDLRAENLALRTDKRVEEYEQRIVNLEYQLDILRRQLGGEVPAGFIPQASTAQTVLSFILYDSKGHMLRLAAAPDAIHDAAEIGRPAAPWGPGDEAPRLLVVPTTEELLFVLSSGRIDSLAVTAIPTGPGPDWAQAEIPVEPRGGETLACVAPVSRLAMAEMVLQASRRGFVKKLMTSLMPSVMNKHYIGTGATLQGDRTHTLALAAKEDRLALVSREGFLLCLEVRDLPFSVEEALKLGPTDLLTSVFVCPPGRSIVAMTQLGKLIHWTEDRLEVVHNMKSRGQALFSAQRREKGTRVVGAAAVRLDDWAAALHLDGRLTVHSVQALVDSGALPGESELVDFTAFSLPSGTSGKAR
jgi:DNA gyrase/topoisomerase IV subunit A